MMLKRIKVGPVWYSVEHVDDLKDMGDCDEATATIRICTGMAVDVEAVTLMHEVLHAALFSLGHVKHSELLVDGLAYQLVQILRENPKLLDIFKKRR